MSWVLIIVIAYGSTGSGVSSVVFADEGLCRHAKLSLYQGLEHSPTHMFAECFPTGRK